MSIQIQSYHEYHELILHKSKIDNIMSNFAIDIDWNNVDSLLSSYSEVGKLYL